MQVTNCIIIIIIIIIIIVVVTIIISSIINKNNNNDNHKYTKVDQNHLHLVDVFTHPRPARRWTVQQALRCSPIFSEFGARPTGATEDADWVSVAGFGSFIIVHSPSSSSS